MLVGKGFIWPALHAPGPTPTYGCDRRYRPTHDHHFSRFTDLPDQVARTLRYPAAQNRVPILRYPYQVMLDFEDRVRASPVFHHASSPHHCMVLLKASPPERRWV
jgi:hypothetical protein